MKKTRKRKAQLAKLAGDLAFNMVKDLEETAGVGTEKSGLNICRLADDATGATHATVLVCIGPDSARMKYLLDQFLNGLRVRGFATDREFTGWLKPRH